MQPTVLIERLLLPYYPGSPDTSCISSLGPGLRLWHCALGNGAPRGGVVHFVRAGLTPSVLRPRRRCLSAWILLVGYSRPAQILSVSLILRVAISIWPSLPHWSMVCDEDSHLPCPPKLQRAVVDDLSRGSTA